MLKRNKTSEKYVQRKVVKYINSLPYCQAVVITRSLYDTGGVADVICNIHGKFLSIECKACPNSPVSELQKEFLLKTRECKGYSLIINNDNFDKLELLIASIINEGVQNDS